jgi:ABC-type maltose transport system permease subunit
MIFFGIIGLILTIISIYVVIIEIKYKNECISVYLEKFGNYKYYYHYRNTAIVGMVIGVLSIAFCVVSVLLYKISLF